MKEEDKDEVEGYIRATEKLLGRDLPSRKSRARSLRLTLDRVNFLH